MSELKKFISPLYNKTIGRLVKRAPLLDIVCGPLYNKTIGRLVRRERFLDTVYIETSSKCNLACAYCYRTIFDYSSKNRNMDFEVFGKIIDGIETYKKDALRLFLHGFGEPTLNPELSKMIYYARSSGKFRYIQFVSNLQAVDREEYDQYFSSGLTNLYVSLDTLDKEIIRNTRRGTNVDEMMNSLAYLSERYSDHMIIITVLSEQNKNELFSLRDFIRRLGIERWNLQLVNKHNGSIGIGASDFEHIKEELKNRSAGISISLQVAGLFKCRQPFLNMVFNAMGYMMPCCSMTNHEIINFGNVKESNVSALFNSHRFNEFRRVFLRERPVVCKDCPYY